MAVKVYRGATLRGGGRVADGRIAGSGYFRIVPDDELQKLVNDVAREKMEALGEAGAEFARAVVRRRTGELANSISGGARVRDGVLEAYVKVSAPHWAFIEYGTGLRGASSAVLPPGLAQGYGFSSDWSGIPAMPYMRPALWHMKSILPGMP